MAVVMSDLDSINDGPEDNSGNVNTQSYWNRRFQGDWMLNEGEEQTLFFARLAVRLMPQWLKSDICARNLSICDFGCANGQASNYLESEFGVPVYGTDFSDAAIATAQRLFPKVHFFVSNILDAKEKAYGVGFCSNVLEHLDDPWGAALSMGEQVSDYLVIMVPFRESVPTPEHVQRFDIDQIPLSVGALRLAYVNAIDASEVPDSKYLDYQVLLVYASGQRSGMLSDYCEALERLGVSKAVKPLEGEVNSLSARLQEVHEYLQRVEDGYQAECRLNGEIQVRYQELEERYHDLARQCRELKTTNRSLVAQDGDLQKKTSELRKMLDKQGEESSRLKKSLDKALRERNELRGKVDALYASHSWRIGRFITAVPRWIKRISRG